MQGAAPFLSIVIATHNRPTLLLRALESVFAQQVLCFEVIVVVDGSQEGYETALQKYYGRAIFVSLVVGSGASAARNLGACTSRGKWIAFLDDDDEYINNYLNVLEKFLAEVPKDTGFVWGGVRKRKYSASSQKVEEEDVIPGSERLDPESLRGVALSIGVGFGVAVDRDCFEDCGGFDETYKAAEDTEFFLRIMSRGYLPSACSMLGVMVHEHLEQRLTLHASYHYKVFVYEEIFWRHFKYLLCHRVSLLGFLGWVAHVHFINGYYLRGCTFLARVMLRQPKNAKLQMSCCAHILYYTARCFVRGDLLPLGERAKSAGR